MNREWPQQLGSSPGKWLLRNEGQQWLMGVDVKVRVESLGAGRRGSYACSATTSRCERAQGEGARDPSTGHGRLAP